MGVVYRSRRRTLRFPQGLVFHIAPGNADTVFVYSWALAALAALAGNRNAVRVSERGGAATEAVLSALAQSLDQADPVVAGTQRIVSYDHLDEAATAELSAACDLRVLWGSDQAITDIRRSPLAACRYGHRRGISPFPTGLPSPRSQRRPFSRPTHPSARGQWKHFIRIPTYLVRLPALRQE